MPFYEYECSNCRYYVEAMQKISDPPLKKCPSCGQKALKKLISAPVFRLKGSGWYETDFKSDQERKRNLAGAESEPAGAKASGEGKTETAAPATGAAPAAGSTPAAATPKAGDAQAAKTGAAASGTSGTSGASGTSGRTARRTVLPASRATHAAGRPSAKSTKSSARATPSRRSATARRAKGRGGR